MLKKFLSPVLFVLALILVVSILPMNTFAKEKNKPYLALGADLNDAERAIVLEKFGISEEDLSDYTVLYVTNQMEHENLDAYIPASVIGTRALSCVRVTPADKGTGITVTTDNINYCTVGMYKNALLTSGVEDADVYVAGPSMISGTAALIGAWMAYEEMTGEELSEERKEAALEEIITTGEIADAVVSDGEDNEGVTKAAVEELISYVKAQVIAQGLTDPDKIKELIEEAQEKYDIHLTEDQIEKLITVMVNVGELDIDPGKLIEQAGDLYEKYGDTVKELYSKVVTDDVKQGFWTMVGGFFKNLFGKIFGEKNS
jgi:uncharacterized protein YpuA (DUF1002 family)